MLSADSNGVTSDSRSLGKKLSQSATPEKAVPPRSDAAHFVGLPRLSRTPKKSQPVVEYQLSREGNALSLLSDTDQVSSLPLHEGING